MITNILNFDDPFKDVPIYRVMHVERIIEILTCKQLSLRQPKQWDDPFENYILRKCNKEGKIKPSYAADIFGQCWSLHEETDAMWRIYSPDKMGAKVKTSVLKLFSTLYHSEEATEYSDLSCYIGKVKYVELEELKKLDDHVEKILAERESSCGIPAAQTLLIKRKEFSHEAEVRLLYVDHYALRKGKLGSGMGALLPLVDYVDFRFLVNPSELFEEIVIDPRMTEHTCNAYSDYFRKIGFTGHISQSSLYKSD